MKTFIESFSEELEKNAVWWESALEAGKGLLTGAKAGVGELSTAKNLGEAAKTMNAPGRVGAVRKIMGDAKAAGNAFSTGNKAMMYGQALAPAAAVAGGTGIVAGAGYEAGKMVGKKRSNG